VEVKRLAILNHEVLPSRPDETRSYMQVRRLDVLEVGDGSEMRVSVADQQPQSLGPHIVPTVAVIVPFDCVDQVETLFLVHVMSCFDLVTAEVLGF
jgi:hypothetical protein